MPPFQLNFNRRHSYQYLETGISLETILLYAGNEHKCEAKVDCGAQYCLFSREIGDTLGVDVEKGLSRHFGTLTGKLVAFGHEVRMGTLGFYFDTTVYFARDPGLPRNLLGRHGWLQALRVAIIDYDQELYLSYYDEQI